MPIYGVYDFTSRLGENRLPFWYRRLEQQIMKAFRDEEPEKFRRASPIERIHASAPPFFIIHGDRDTLAPVEEARYFADALGQVSGAPVHYAELSGAQHAFDLFCSPRTAHMLVAVLKFLDATHAAHTRIERAQGRSPERFAEPSHSHVVSPRSPGSPNEKVTE